MAINLKSTKQYASSGVKILVYGQAGAGKTTLIKTLPDPVIISTESGLLSLQGCDIPYIEINSLAGLQEAYQWLTKSEEGAKFKSVALDSISEIAEVVLVNEKSSTRDGRMAYAQMGERMTQIIRSFRDLPNKHVYFSAKMKQSDSESGYKLNGPSMPGQSLTQGVSYFFDEVLALRLKADGDGNIHRTLQCDERAELGWTAKDRSGRLGMWEPADLGAVIDKIGGAGKEGE